MPEKPPFSSILVCRTDRIGDVVLSLPMIEVLHRHFPAARISFLARSTTKEIVEGQPGLHAVVSYDLTDRPKAFFSLLSELRSYRFDVAVLAYPTFRLALVLFFAGIPLRVGTGYRWYSFLFNRRVFEHRKTAEKHELEYNLSLLEAIGCTFDRYPAPVLALSREQHLAAELIRAELGANGGEVVVLHPGSGGSARDWSAEKFGLLARALRQKGFSVIVTGGPGEETLVEGIVRAGGPGVRPLVNRLSLMQLAAMVQKVGLFISNSTGPLHLAAAVGTPVIAFYPPILACSPERWGPYTDHKILFVPERAKCPRCHGGPCEGSECMDLIQVDDVLTAVDRLMTHKTNPIVKVRS
jgi:lipopolysaccharide heptosyltransferase II